jgi:hypothetical protein
MQHAWEGELNVCSILVGKPEGKSPLERIRNRQVEIRMNLRETGWEGVQ